MYSLVPVVRVMSVLPTLRVLKYPGALMSYHSFFRKGSVLCGIVSCGGVVCEGTIRIECREALPLGR